MKEIHKIQGVVVEGDKRGKKLGFPTANVLLHKKIPEGIYAASVIINGKQYRAASFIGSAKTFQKTDVRLESFLFNFDQDLYGKHICVSLHKKIRDNKYFDSVEDLIEQMKKDVSDIKAFFQENS